jgi:VanZ family protein
MRIFFSILSIAYIAVIFLFADSSVVSTLAPFNPYSLLHIPLYGVLTVLLIFSFMPLKFKLLNSINPRNSTNAMNSTTAINATNSTNSINSSNLNARYLFVGFIALVVAIADEIHQAYVPGRDASITDVLLDLVGIILVLFFFFRLLKTKPSLIH